jgi:hypothetical protein
MTVYFEGSDMKFLFQFLVVAVLAAAPLSSAYAQYETRDGEETSSSKSSSSNNGSSSSGQAKAAQMAQIIGVGANVAMGAAMFSKCGPHCGWCCAAGAMSMANAASMLANSAQSGNTVNALDDWNPSDFWNDLGLDDDPNVTQWNPTDADLSTPDSVNGVIQTGMSDFAEYGYSYDPVTGQLTTPEGTFSPAVLEDTQAAAAAGFNSSGMELGQGEALAISSAFDNKLKASGALDKLNRPSVSGVAVDSTGGGGGGSGGGGYGGLNSSGFGDYLAKMKRGLASKKKGVIAGKSRMLGGEKIGVKVDDIFAMVHRRYQAKRKTNGFIETGSKGAKKK